MSSSESLLTVGEVAAFQQARFEDFPPGFRESLGTDFDDYLEEKGLTSLFDDPFCTQPQVAEDEVGKVFSFRFDGNVVVNGEVLTSATELILADHDLSGAQIGLGVVTRHFNKGENTPPFVGWTETYEAFRGRAAGGRRLKYMNQLCLQNFGQPLRSALNGYIEDEAKRVWQKLVDEGVAEFIDIQVDPHWQFKS